MTPTPRRSRVAATLIVCVFLASACAQATQSPSPDSSASPSSGPPSIAPSVSPGATPGTTATPSATPTAVPSPTLAADCEVEAQEGPLSSDRITDVVISSTDEADLITFVFGNASLPGPAGEPRGDLTVAEPPYSEAASGQLIEMQGQRVLQVRFRQMSLYSDTGDATYDGPREFVPDLPVLRHAVQYDATEGQIGWYVGFDGPGCVRLGRTGNDVTVAIERP